MLIFRSLLSLSLAVIAATACRTTTQGPARSDLASAEDDTNGSLAGPLFYQYTLSRLTTEIAYAPDFDSNIILTVALSDQGQTPRVQTYLSGSSGYEQTITFDLASGVIKRVNKQVGNEVVRELKAPKLEPATRTEYLEALAQLLDQVSAIREGRYHKNDQHLELNDLVSYLEQVVQEVKSMVVQKEFTGGDAVAMIATFARLGLTATRDTSGLSSIKLSSVVCTRGDGSSRLDPTTGIVCSLNSGRATRLAEAESEGIYRLFVKNGAREDANSAGKTIVRMTDLRCVEYSVTHGVSKCFYKQ